MTLEIRPLRPEERSLWEPLWQGYLTFYKASLPREVTDTTWARLQDPVEPMHLRGAFDGGKLLGIVHFIEHRTCWSTKSVIYLQDLFAVPETRGRGVGRALIQRVYDEAAAMGMDKVYWQTHETNAVAQVLYNAVADRTGFIVYKKMI